MERSYWWSTFSFSCFYVWLSCSSFASFLFCPPLGSLLSMQEVRNESGQTQETGHVTMSCCHPRHPQADPLPRPLHPLPPTPPHPIPRWQHHCGSPNGLHPQKLAALWGKNRKETLSIFATITCLLIHLNAEGFVWGFQGLRSLRDLGNNIRRELQWMYYCPLICLFALWASVLFLQETHKYILEWFI